LNDKTKQMVKIIRLLVDIHTNFPFSRVSTCILSRYIIIIKHTINKFIKNYVICTINYVNPLVGYV